MGTVGKGLNSNIFPILSVTGVSLIGGAIAGLAVQFNIGFVSFFLALIYGLFIGELILRLSGRKRAAEIEYFCASGLTLGAIGARVFAAPSLSTAGNGYPPLGVINVLVDLVLPTPLPLVCLVLVIAACICRIRYL